MISNERPTFGARQYADAPAKPTVMEETIKTDRIQIERKSFIFTLKENPRGRVLRLTEDVNGRRDSIIVPATGLEEFRKQVEAMALASAETPPKA